MRGPFLSRVLGLLESRPDAVVLVWAQDVVSLRLHLGNAGCPQILGHMETAYLRRHRQFGHLRVPGRNGNRGNLICRQRVVGADRLTGLGRSWSRDWSRSLPREAVGV